MKFLFWLLAIFVLAVALSLAVHNPGYVVLVYPPYRAELSLSLFVIGLLAAFVFGYLAIRLATAALRMPEYVREFRRKRTLRKGREAMLESLTAYFQENNEQAEKAAARSIELNEDKLLSSVIAAHCADRLHEYARRDAYLEAIEGKTREEQVLKQLTIAKFSLQQNQPKPALDALKALQESGMRSHAGAMRLEIRALQQAHDWDGVLELAVQASRRGAMDATTLNLVKQNAWLEKIRAAAGDAEALNAIWKRLPTELRVDSKFALAGARILIHAGEHAAARKIIADSLESQWDSPLCLLYGDCLSGDPVGQIEQAERWLQSHPNDASLLLSLGKLCLHQELWGKAQNYLDASISITPSRAAYMELGRLAQLLQRESDAFDYFHQAMLLENV